MCVCAGWGEGAAVWCVVYSFCVKHNVCSVHIFVLLKCKLYIRDFNFNGSNMKKIFCTKIDSADKYFQFTSI